MILTLKNRSIAKFFCSRAFISSAAMPKEEKLALGITENLIRISVGAEDPEDIVGDLKQALDQL